MQSVQNNETCQQMQTSSESEQKGKYDQKYIDKWNKAIRNTLVFELVEFLFAQDESNFALTFTQSITNVKINFPEEKDTLIPRSFRDVLSQFDRKEQTKVDSSSSSDEQLEDKDDQLEKLIAVLQNKNSPEKTKQIVMTILSSCQVILPEKINCAWVQNPDICFKYYYNEWWREIKYDQTSEESDSSGCPVSQNLVERVRIKHQEFIRKVGKRIGSQEASQELILYADKWYQHDISSTSSEYICQFSPQQQVMQEQTASQHLTQSPMTDFSDLQSSNSGKKANSAQKASNSDKAVSEFKGYNQKQNDSQQ